MIPTSRLTPMNATAARSFVLLLAVTGTAMVLPKLFGVLILFGVLWSWMSILHSAGHDAYFRSKRANIFAGSVASLFLLVPFFPWRYHHAEHHTWTGWVEKDPTVADLPAVPPAREKLGALNVMWKLWLPVFSLAHVLTHLWNPMRLKTALTSRKYRESLFSIALILITHVTVLFFAPNVYLTVYLPALGLFLFTCDPVLLSQHARIPLERVSESNRKVYPFPLTEHDRYTRSFSVHPLIDRWVLLNFNLHNVHHRYPNVAHYDLHRIPHDASTTVSFIPWVRALKKLHVHDVLFGTDPRYAQKKTGGAA